MVAIRLENLTKTFGRGKRRVQAVQQVDLEVEAGQVYGFLGPNGAGKTTAIRMMLDLMRPNDGTAYIYDEDVRQNHSVLRQVGSLVEGATFYPYLTGHRNLEILQRTYGDYNSARIDEILKLVGLDDRAKQRFRKYSLGMKQRLGLAAALLHDPKLLILDEPTNGLDPAGIQEMRTFIRSLVDNHGKTVFLSSHMLNEVEQICDRVAIINLGQIIREGDVKTLLNEKARIQIRATPVEKALVIINEHWTVSTSRQAFDSTFSVETSEEHVPFIIRKLVENDIQIYEVVHKKQSLEEFFLKATGVKITDTAEARQIGA